MESPEEEFTDGARGSFGVPARRAVLLFCLAVAGAARRPSLAPAAAQAQEQARAALHRHDRLPSYRRHQQRSSRRPDRARGRRIHGRLGGLHRQRRRREQLRQRRQEPAHLHRREPRALRRDRAPELLRRPTRPARGATRSGPRSSSTSRTAAASPASTTPRTWAPPPRHGTGGTATTATRSSAPRCAATPRPTSTNIAQVQVADHNHLATRDLPDTYGFGDEHYNFNRNVRGTHHVLATLDERTYTPGGNAMGQDHPITWCKLYDGDNINDNTATPKRYTDGRTWVTRWATSAPPTPRTAATTTSIKPIVGGVRWVAGEGRKSDCSGTVWSSFTRKVLVADANNPIGVDVAKDGKVYWTEIGNPIGLTSDGLREDARPAKPAGNKTTVITIPTRADHGNSEDGVLGMSLQPGFDLADPNKRNVFVYYSPRNAGLADHRQRPGRRLQPDQPLHAQRRRHGGRGGLRARDPARPQGQDRRHALRLPGRPDRQRPRPRGRRRAGLRLRRQPLPRRRRRRRAERATATTTTRRWTTAGRALGRAQDVAEHRRPARQGRPHHAALGDIPADAEPGVGATYAVPARQHVPGRHGQDPSRDLRDGLPPAVHAAHRPEEPGHRRRRRVLPRQHGQPGRPLPGRHLRVEPHRQGRQLRLAVLRRRQLGRQHDVPLELRDQRHDRPAVRLLADRRCRRTSATRRPAQTAGRADQRRSRHPARPGRPGDDLEEVPSATNGRRRRLRRPGRGRHAADGRPDLPLRRDQREPGRLPALLRRLLAHQQPWRRQRLLEGSPDAQGQQPDAARQRLAAVQLAAPPRRAPELEPRDRLAVRSRRLALHGPLLGRLLPLEHERDPAEPDRQDHFNVQDECITDTNAPTASHEVTGQAYPDTPTPTSTPPAAARRRPTPVAPASRTSSTASGETDWHEYTTEVTYKPRANLQRRVPRDRPQGQRGRDQDRDVHGPADQGHDGPDGERHDGRQQGSARLLRRLDHGHGHRDR